MARNKRKAAKKVDYEDFLEMLRNIASHFCTAKVLYRKMPVIKKQDPINEALYPGANIIFARYRKKSNQIWVNKNKAVIDLYSKYPEHFLHEIGHAIQPSHKPRKWTEWEVFKAMEADENDASRWAVKKIEYYARYPKKWEKLLMERGKYWEQTYKSGRKIKSKNP